MDQQFDACYADHMSPSGAVGDTTEPRGTASVQLRLRVVEDPSLVRAGREYRLAGLRPAAFRTMVVRGESRATHVPRGSGIAVSTMLRPGDRVTAVLRS